MEKLFKYPKTHHLPWSESNSSDDVWWKNTDWFDAKQVVVTEKLDGECTTMYRDRIHARSLDTDNHESRTWIKRFHGSIAHQIDPGWRICGENLYGFHSIFYKDLPTYFFVYGIYNPENRCVSWDDTVEICELLGLETVPLIYRGDWNPEVIKARWTGAGRYQTFGTKAERPVWPDTFSPTTAEGYVVRTAGEFAFEDFAKSVAKYVRPGHVQTPSNWLQREVLPNGLL